jgi:hypothetical protein
MTLHHAKGRFFDADGVIVCQGHTPAARSLQVIRRFAIALLPINLRPQLPLNPTHD